MTEFEKVIEEKFTRCPQCRSFSVRLTDEFTPAEKFKTYFLPVSAFVCDNCNYRHVEFGTFSDTLKDFFTTGGTHEKKWIVAVIPTVIIIAVVAAFILLSGTNEPYSKKIDKKQQTAQTQPIRKPVEEKTAATQEPLPGTTQTEPGPTTQTGDQTTQPQPGDQKQVEPKIEDAIPVILENSTRFGVNWNLVENGVRILRMSNGPLKQAGMEIGDIVTEIDGQKIEDSGHLLRVRDQILRGVRSEAILTVLRGDTVHYFKLLKSWNKPGTQKPPTDSLPQEEKKTTPTEPETPTLSKKTTVFKLFSQSLLKQRKSSPSSESASNSWRFARTTVSLRRTGNQQVYVAGDPTGTKKWGADNFIKINGRLFEGVTNEYDGAVTWMPEELQRLPLDITDLVPADRPVTLSIELIDYGRFFGNTDIYIVIK